MIGQVIVILGLLSAWWFGAHRDAQVLLLDIALGITGTGNSGMVFAALFAPGLANAYRWTNVLGLAAERWPNLGDGGFRKRPSLGSSEPNTRRRPPAC